MSSHPMIHFWALALLLFVAQSYPYEHQIDHNNGAHTDAACPSNQNCTCSTPGYSAQYEYLCSSNLSNPALIIGVQPEVYVQLQCRSMNNSEDLELVKGLRFGPIKSFSSRLCPLPNIPYAELLEMAGITGVKTIQVESYSNLSDTLKQYHFRRLQDLDKLYFSSNLLTDLPENLFADMGNLTWLDLKNNKVRLPKGIFGPLTKLEVLELGSNSITYLEPGTFRNLTRLRLLNIWGNRLQNLSRALFLDLPNLETLDLNSNGLNTLPPDIFADLHKLKNINLNTNEFYALPQGLFLSNPKLAKFQLHNNRRPLRSLPSLFLANLTSLTEVYLDNCNLTRIPEDIFWGSTAITTLTLHQNQLTSLPYKLLRDAKDLQVLNLRKNKITMIPDNFFVNQQKLTTLDLSYNLITAISDFTFQGLAALEYLQLHHNTISLISRDSFSKPRGPQNLKKLDLSHNALTEIEYKINGTDPSIGQYSIFHKSTHLLNLDLSHNNLTHLYYDWQVTLTNLKSLNLSDNRFTNLTTSDLTFTSGNLMIDFSRNMITTLQLDVLEPIALSRFKGIPTTTLENKSVQIKLRGNPLECDCKIFHFIKFLKGQLTPEVNYIVEFDVDGLYCSGPPELKDTEAKSLDTRLLICPWSAFTQMSLSNDCPAPCSCIYRRDDAALIVDCSSKELTEWPSYIPILPFLEKNISSSKSIALQNLINHTELDLSHNLLTSFPTQFSTGYSTVTKLSLAHNQLKSVNLSKFSKLQLLDLQGNNLTSLDSNTIRALEKSKQLEKIALHHNPWTCDCSSKDLLNYILVSFKKVSNFGNVSCSDGKILTNMTVSELCPTTGVTIWVGSMIIAILGLLIGGLTVLYYRYQKEVKVWLYANRLCLWFVTEEELDKDKKYDAFVSFSHQDESFVVEKLVPGLEEGSNKYKLCLHYRDWIVGDFIPSQITRSVEESRRTIVILSPSFIESIWGRMEFRTAHSQALTEGRARVIVILYGEIGDTENLDPELKAYLSMNTYIRWGDPWFWERLRYALPHPQKISSDQPPVPSSCLPFSLFKTRAQQEGINNTPQIIEPMKTLNSKPV